MNMCTWLENKLLDHTLRNIPYTPPPTVYVALLTADPTEVGNTTYEVSGGAYARQALTFDESSGGITQIKYDVEFPQATANWGTITHVLILDAKTGGNPMLHGALNVAKTITVDDILKIPLGKLTVQFK